MRLTHSRFGVIFVPSEITGRNKGLAAYELIRMAFHEDGSICVILTQADLDALLEGKTTFWSMLLEKIEHVRFGKPKHSRSAQSKLRRINGIGPKRAEKLEKAGITTLAALASADAMRVADALPGVKVKMAKAWQEEVGTLMGSDTEAT